MAGPLNYHPRTSAVYYRPPRKVEFLPFVISFAIALVAIVVGSFFYARILPNLSNVYYRVGAWAVAFLSVGALSIIPIRFGKVQSPLVAAVVGTVLGLVALYAMWVTWTVNTLQRAGLLVEYWPVIKNPSAFLSLIRFINSVGAWSYRQTDVRGPALLLVWIVEGAAVVACGVLFPIMAIVKEDPVCPTCSSRCVRAPRLPTFSTERQAELVASVEARKFDDLAHHSAPENEYQPELALALFCCPGCGECNVLTVNHVSLVPNSAGTTIKTVPVVDRLRITRDEVAQIAAVCDRIAEERGDADSDDVSETEPDEIQ